MKRLRRYITDPLQRWLPRLAPGVVAWWSWWMFALETLERLGPGAGS